MGVYSPIVNMVQRGFARAFPEYFGLSSKHNHARDFGWPAALAFDQFFRMYQRNGLASAAVDKTVAKTWETHPALWESEKPAETALEEDIRRRFADIRLWQALMNVDRRSLVGAYSGAILMLADGMGFDQPVERVGGGLDGLVGIIPAWQSQLTVAEWDDDPASPNYGWPRFYQFDETAVGGSQQGRQLRIHPDRVLIWSEDGSVNGRSALEAGYNDLLDAEKVKGAGGEGFWKTARGAPLIEAPKEMSVSDFMQMMGADTPEAAQDEMNAQLDRFNEGFDRGLMLGGLKATPLTITLPQPEQFFNVPVMSFAASMQVPMRILIGNQTGERASTEDAEEWARVNMARRANLCMPMLHDLVSRLVRWGILPERDWTIGWESLLDDTPDDKLGRAAKMAEINAREPTFMVDEIREAAGYEPAVLPDEPSEDDEVLE